MGSVRSLQDGVGVGPHWVASALVEVKRRQDTLSRNKWLAGLVTEGEEIWSKVLFPSPAIEAWKYTNTDPIAKGSFSLSPQAPGEISAEALSPALIPGLNAYYVVFVDGMFVPLLSSKVDAKGLLISRIAAGGSAEGVGSLAPHATDSFAALATALMVDGVSIVVASNEVISTPIHIVNVSTSLNSSAIVTPRLYIEAGEASQVTVVESHVSVGGEGYLSLPVVEIVAADGATVDYYKIQDEAESASHVSNTIVSQGRSGNVSAHIFSFGGELVRNNISVLLKGSGAFATLNGLSVLKGSQHVDNSTLIHHIEPSIESREHFKGIYSDSSRGVFSGTITVDQVAQKTNAFQSNQALLLSPHASIETRPQLKIWADDVKCTHGATVGQLDQEAMFYLRARGIGQDDARNFLIHAFASEVLSSVRVAPLKEHIEALITAKLGR